MKYDEEGNRRKTIESKIYQIITDNKPEIAIKKIVENIPEFYAFLIKRLTP